VRHRSGQTVETLGRGPAGKGVIEDPEDPEDLEDPEDPAGLSLGVGPADGLEAGATGSGSISPRP